MRLVLELSPHIAHLALQRLVFLYQHRYLFLSLFVKLWFCICWLLRSATFCLLGIEKLVLRCKQLFVLLL